MYKAVFNVCSHTSITGFVVDLDGSEPLTLKSATRHDPARFTYVPSCSRDIQLHVTPFPRPFMWIIFKCLYTKILYTLSLSLFILGPS
jgi:hypothetical protein